MTNTTLTADIVLKEAKRKFVNLCPFITSLGRNYDGVITAEGAKAGDSIRIRRPMKYTMRTGKTMAPQNNTETSETLTRSIWNGVDLIFSQKELTMDISEFGPLYIDPAIGILASGVEAAAMTLAYQGTANAITLPATNLDREDIIEARKQLTEFSAPANGRFAVLNPDGEGDIINQNASLFNPQAVVSRQYTEGEIGKAYGFDFASTPNVPSMKNGADVAGAIDGAGQTGATLVTKDFTAAPTVGSSFTIANVYALNPANQVSTGKLQRFVVGAGATTTSVPISPSIITTGNQKTVDSIPADSAIISSIGLASTSYPMNLFYQKLAYAFSTVDLEIPNGLDFAARNTEQSLAMTIMRNFDIINADILCRIDIVWGLKPIIPEWATKVYGIGV